MVEQANGRSDLAPLRGLRCTVLGAGGFFGTNLIRSLDAQGAKVTAAGRLLTFPDAKPDSVRWVSAELDDRIALRHVVDGADVVFYLLSASVPGTRTREPTTDLIADCGPALHLLEVCRDGTVGKIVFASSGGTVYGTPTTIPITEDCATTPISFYGINKLLIEKYLALYGHAFGVDYHILRVSNPFGPFQQARKRQGLVAEVINKILHKKPIEIWGDGTVVRDFIHIDDVVDALTRAATYQGPHRVMNVASGVGRSVLEVVHDIATLIGEPADVRMRPGRKADVPVNVLDTSLIRREFGWRPRIAWDKGLRTMIEWARDQDAFDVP